MSRPIEPFNPDRELESYGEHVLHDDIHIDHELPIEDAMPLLGNEELPIFAFKETIVDSVERNSLTIIVASTGAGKSTQVPLYLYEAGYAVNITQPRRVAARNVHNRLKEEVCDAYGENAGEYTVSFQTAEELVGPRDAPIHVLTDGLHVLKELDERSIAENDVLIIDEAHEWNSNVELLIAWTKKALAENPNRRIVVMSATMDATGLAEFYEKVLDVQPNIIEVPGRTFDVERQEKPQSTQLIEIVNAIEQEIGLLEKEPDQPHDILAFVPGQAEIANSISAILRRLPGAWRDKVVLLPLHAKLSPAQQQEALEPKEGMIRVISSTNIAQTSLTISGIKYVIDCGYQNSTQIDSEGGDGIVRSVISKADCDQRAGRAGRVAPGIYILTRLDEKTPHVLYEDRDEYPIAEVLRTDAARSYLRLKDIGINFREFDTYHKVSSRLLDFAEVQLEYLDAIDKNREITPIGEKMNEFPLNASSARMMVEAMRYKPSTRAYTAAITASVEAGKLQYFGIGVGKRWLTLSDEVSSDLLLQLDLFIAAQDMSLEELVEHDLDINSVKRAKEYFEKVAKKADAPTDPLTPPSAEEREDIKRCIISAHLGSVYRRLSDGTYVHASNAQLTTRREIGRRSIISAQPEFVIGRPFHIEMFKEGMPYREDYLDNVTAVTAIELGAVAAHKTKWVPEGYFNRQGKYYERQRMHLYGLDLGMTQEVPATPSYRLRQDIIAEALQNPGAQQQKLREVKRELERLAHRARDPIPQLTQRQLEELIHRAAPDDITTPSTIEDNLRVMMMDPNERLSVEALLTPERIEHIMLNSPDTLIVDGCELHVTYKSRKPLVNIGSQLESILDIDESVREVQLDDGREILFLLRDADGHTHRYTLQQLRKQFGQ